MAATIHRKSTRQGIFKCGQVQENYSKFHSVVKSEVSNLFSNIFLNYLFVLHQ